MTRSIEAYDDAERIRIYDRDMDLLHPNRHRMAEVILDLLASGPRAPGRILELGSGTGFLTARVLRRFPAAGAIAVDGSPAMMPVLRARLAGSGLTTRMRQVISSFEALTPADLGTGPFDAVISSYALHHLSPEAKGRCLDIVLDRLRPGGWFLNADLVVNPRDGIEAVIETVRARRIVERCRHEDARFPDEAAVRAFIASLQESEADQPLHLEEDLTLLRDRGVANATVFWQEYREVVYGGWKPARPPRD